MAQFQHMDACLDTLTIEMYQVNTCVGCIVRRLAHLGGFVESSSPSLEASNDKDDSGDSGGTSDGDEAFGSSSDDEMTASQ